jgi:DNA polymerase-4
VTLEVEFSDFTIITRSKTIANAVSSRGEIEALSTSLLSSIFPISRPIRLLGVSISKLDREPADEEQQAPLLI